MLGQRESAAWPISISPSSAAASTARASPATRPGAGLRVLLVEQDDLASGTSSASTKLIHGGLRYLEHDEFRLVREALIEREVLLRDGAAHHPAAALRAAACSQGMRPAWMLRLGLFLYDHLGGRKHPAGDPHARSHARSRSARR